MARLLSPRGRACFVSVNGSDVAQLLSSGGRVLREDDQCSKQPDARGGGFAAAATTATATDGARERWRDKKQQLMDQVATGAADAARPPMVLEEIEAHEQKHIFVCRNRTAEDDAAAEAAAAGGGAAGEGEGEDAGGGEWGGLQAPKLLCGVCGKSWRYPDFPSSCPKCANGLRRFALS